MPEKYAGLLGGRRLLIVGLPCEDLTTISGEERKGQVLDFSMYQWFCEFEFHNPFVSLQILIHWHLGIDDQP